MTERIDIAEFQELGYLQELNRQYLHPLGLASALAPRKREAFFFNVVMDMKQRDVAEKMNITTVSVGQYVDAACEQMAVEYFGDGRNQDVLEE